METATERFDLEGNSAGEVTEEHRQHASETPARNARRKNAERRKAQREAEAKQRKAEAEAQRHAEKLNQLAEKIQSQIKRQKNDANQAGSQLLRGQTHPQHKSG
jgi:sRNA-binding protein